MSKRIVMTHRMVAAVMVVAVIRAVGVVSLEAQADASPLRLILTCEKLPLPSLRLTLENVSDASTAAVIGAIIGNYRIYSPDGLLLTIRRPGDSDTSVGLTDRSVGAIGGRVDQWLLALPAGSAFSMTLPLRRFGAAEQLARPADIQLRLTTRSLSEKDLSSGLSDQRFIPLWMGDVTSNWLRFPDYCTESG